MLRKSSSVSSTDTVALRRSANAGLFRLITVKGASIEIEGIWLQGGRFTSGPGLYVTFASQHYPSVEAAASAGPITNTLVTLKNCRVTDNVADQGGAIALMSADRSSYTSGGFVMKQGSIHLNLIDTELTSNTGATAGSGGALSIMVAQSPQEILYSVNASGTTRIHSNTPLQGCRGSTPRWTSGISSNSQLVCEAFSCTSPKVLPPGGIGCYCIPNAGSTSYYGCDDPGGSGTCANSVQRVHQAGAPSALRNAWACAKVCCFFAVLLRLELNSPLTPAFSLSFFLSLSLSFSLSLSLSLSLPDRPPLPRPPLALSNRRTRPTCTRSSSLRI